MALWGVRPIHGERFDVVMYGWDKIVCKRANTFCGKELATEKSLFSGWQVRDKGSSSNRRRTSDEVREVRRSAPQVQHVQGSDAHIHAGRQAELQAM